MTLTVKRDSGLFSPEQADELNKAFYKINQDIENYEAPPIAYTENVRLINPSGFSFISGNLVCLREKLIIKEAYSQFTKVGSLEISIPYDYWCTAPTSGKETLMFHLTGSDIYCYGTLASYPQTAYLTEDFVLPQNSL